MHEYGVTQGLIETVEKFATEKGVQSIKAVNLVVGDFSGCLADSVQLYFEVLTEGTVCSGAILNIERVKPTLKCKVCDKEFDRKPFDFACTHLNADGTNCIGEGEPTQVGREFYIKSIEVE